MKKVIILYLLVILSYPVFTAMAAQTVDDSFLKSINTEADETSCTISANGKLFIFIRKPKNNTNGDIYYTEFKSGRWTEAEPATDLNSEADETSPFISQNGNFILFSSNRPGSLKDSSSEKPSYDIYYSERKGDGWEKPALLFGAVNTPDDEINPCLAEGGKTLYFTRIKFNNSSDSKIIKVRNTSDIWEDVQTAEISDNRIADVYMLKKSENKPGFYFTGQKKKESTKKQLFYSDETGKNIYSMGSSAGDEITLCELNKNTLVVSTNENGAGGSYDFVIKKVSEEIKKESPSTYTLKFENSGYNNTDGIKIKILYFKSAAKDSWPERSEIMSPDNTGTIVISADPDIKRILVLPGQQDMKPFNVEFYTENDSISTYTIKVESLPDRQFILRPVYFNFNSCEISIKDIPYIHELIDYLRINEKIKISIDGYADGFGTYRSNIDISTRRAEKISDYLVKNGISKERITTKGHGYTKDKSRDTSQYNRRVEFNIPGQ